MWAKIKANNESLVLLLFGIGWICYALGIANFGKAFSTQTFFLVGIVLFFILNFRAFSFSDVKILSLPLTCFVIVLILGLLTFFDEVLVRSFSQVLKATNQNILGYVPLFFGLFLYARYAKRANVGKFFGIFMLFCVLNVLAMIFLLLQNGKTHNVPFFFQAVYTYNIWLLAPFAFALSAIVACKNKRFKMLGLFLLILTCVAIYSNGERSFIVAGVVMAFMPFIAWRYKHKLMIIIVAFLLFGAGLVGFYHYSKNLSLRFNFANALNHFSTVWHTPPALMGIYDKECFNEKASWLICAKESLEQGKSEISFEHSMLSRINMTKSTLLAFFDEPLSPHSAGVFDLGEYLAKYYQANPSLNRSYIRFSDTQSPNYKANGYNHPHNFAVSVLFSYGVFGFLAIVIFQGFLLISALKGIKSIDSMKQFLGLSLFVLTCGVMAQSLFDGFYVIILKCIFILQGALAGVCWQNEDSTHH